MSEAIWRSTYDLLTCGHSLSLKVTTEVWLSIYSHCVWTPPAMCARSVTSREYCKMLRFLWQCLYNTGAWRPHTAPRDPAMRVNKPGEPSLTPCVATYSADGWENKVRSSMITTSPFLRIFCYNYVWWRLNLMTSLWDHNWAWPTKF